MQQEPHTGEDCPAHCKREPTTILFERKHNMSELNTNTAAETTNAPEVKLTRREKLLAQYNAACAKHTELAAKMAELVEEINSIDALAAVDVGHTVIISVGKGDEAKEVEASVIGVREEEDGSKTYKVTYGSGFDADIAVVKGNKLKLPVAVAAEAAAE